jgi:hypothetical protein
MKFNSISYDFPFQVSHSFRADKPTKQEYKKQCNDLRNSFNNESPDFFRLDAMKENPKMYKNPYLSEVIKFDRNEFFSDADKTRQHINFINEIKRRRDWSQNPNYLKMVKGCNDRAVIEKRNKIKTDPYIPKENHLNEEPNSEYYKSALKHIHYNYSPKHHYLVKKSLDLNNNINEGNTNLKLNVDPWHSGGFRNFNSYSISENYKEKDNFLVFDKKERNMYNCITDTVQRVKPDRYVSEKWSGFYEKYFILI